MIKQVFQKNQIQTCLELDVNGIRVSYYKNPEAFQFIFKIYQEVPTQDAADAVIEIVRTLCYQSYDHGAEWRQVGRTEYEAPSEYKYYHTFKVDFRIRDPY